MGGWAGEARAELNWTGFALSSGGFRSGLDGTCLDRDSAQGPKVGS